MRKLHVHKKIAPSVRARRPPRARCGTRHARRRARQQAARVRRHAARPRRCSPHHRAALLGGGRAGSRGGGWRTWMAARGHRSYILVVGGAPVDARRLGAAPLRRRGSGAAPLQLAGRGLRGERDKHPHQSAISWQQHRERTKEESERGAAGRPEHGAAAEGTPADERDSRPPADERGSRPPA